MNALQDETGVSGEIDVTVRARDITDPKVIAWMTRYQHGRAARPRLQRGQALHPAHNAPELCPALSLPDLFSTGAGRRRCARCSTRCRATSPRA